MDLFAPVFFFFFTKLMWAFGHFLFADDVFIKFSPHLHVSVCDSILNNLH